MADKLSPAERSRNMSHIRSKDTAIEVRVRKALFRDGFRYRKNVKELPGKPDIVLSKYKTVIFVHGCYWHAHNCKEFHIPSSNKEFWIGKFQKNINRDVRDIAALQSRGWNVIVVWQCEVESQFQQTIRRIEDNLLFGIGSNSAPEITGTCEFVLR